MPTPAYEVSIEPAWRGLEEVARQTSDAVHQLDAEHTIPAALAHRGQTRSSNRAGEQTGVDAVKSHPE
jgi:hypothetical protein